MSRAEHGDDGDVDGSGFSSGVGAHGAGQGEAFAAKASFYSRGATGFA